MATNAWPIRSQHNKPGTERHAGKTNWGLLVDVTGTQLCGRVRNMYPHGPTCKKNLAIVALQTCLFGRSKSIRHSARTGNESIRLKRPAISYRPQSAPTHVNNKIYNPNWGGGVCGAVTSPEGLWPPPLGSSRQTRT